MFRFIGDGLKEPTSLIKWGGGNFAPQGLSLLVSVLDSLWGPGSHSTGEVRKGAVNTWGYKEKSLGESKVFYQLEILS